MKGHPGGQAHTLDLIARSGLKPPAKLLDMGAGAGETLALLRELGYDAVGIDLEPRSDTVRRGDFLNSGFPDGYFDGIVSQCAFYVCENVSRAMQQAARMLRPGGILMLSDVTPADQNLAALARNAGLRVLCTEDQTPAWKEYYIEAIWRGTADCLPVGRKYRYTLLIAQKEEL